MFVPALAKLTLCPYAKLWGLSVHPRCGLSAPLTEGHSQGQQTPRGQRVPGGQAKSIAGDC